MPLPEPQLDAGRVRSTIEAILARPEFAPEPRSWLERLRDLVLERLGDLLAALLDAGAGGLVGWVVVAVLGVVAVVLALRLTRGLRPDPVAAPGTEPAPGRSAVDWRADAAAHEAAGQWRAALRCRWRALVADLAGRGLVEEVPGRTAGEYRRQVAEVLPEAASDFDAATTLFEEAWYGEHPVGAEQAERLRALSRRVLAG
ncbi:MAG: DUF4129 domain-containing protein [Actinomycetota bacterium]|nr:DUF4129 domain-containing protein [Actinomycetota bacterium]